MNNIVINHSNALAYQHYFLLHSHLKVNFHSFFILFGLSCRVSLFLDEFYFIRMNIFQFDLQNEKERQLMNQINRTKKKLSQDEDENDIEEQTEVSS